MSALTVRSMLVLCDLDATLLDRDAGYARWAERLAYACGVGAERRCEFVRSVVTLAAERPGAEAIVAFVREALALPGSPTELLEAFKEEFARVSVLAPGVARELSKLRTQGARIAVVTNGEERLQHLKVQVSGLEALVDEVVISGAEGVAKPDPALLEIAAARCGESLAAAWMVGDQADTDIRAAAAAGIPSVWVAHGSQWVDADCAPTATTPECAAALALVARQVLPHPRSSS